MSKGEKIVSEGQIIWKETPKVSNNLSPMRITEYYKHKFNILGEEMIEKANEIGKNLKIEINFKWSDMEC